MRPKIRRGLPQVMGCALLAGALVGLAEDAAAQTDLFYKTNKLTPGTSSNPGGSYDAYMRLLARHMARHIPGAPTIVVQNVSAGGGMALANMIYNTAAKDGSYVGVLHGTIVQDELFASP